MLDAITDNGVERGEDGLCGTAPSDRPDMAEFLVECGIDLMSASTGSPISVKQHVAKTEGPR